MTTLTLQAVSLNEQQLTRPLMAVFDEAGGSIGRADHNTLALPDPERHISRMQAQIRRVADGYAIHNVGSATPIVVAGRTLASGESAPLSDGVRIVIGGYLLEAVLAERTAASIDAVVPRPERPFVVASANDPFADLLTPTPKVRDPGSTRAAAVSDPFAALQSVPSGRPTAESPFGGLLDDVVVPSLDAMFGLQGDAAGALDGFVHGDEVRRPTKHPDGAPTSPDHTPLLRAAYAPPSPPAAAASVVPAALIPNDATWLRLGERLAPAVEPPAARHPAPVVARPAPADGGSMPDAVEGAAVTPPLPARHDEPHAMHAAAASELQAAFCDGAGLQAHRVPPIDAAQMRLIGGVLRAAVEGTLQLVALRATTKHELRAQVTVIQSRDNNPLKFSPDAQGALEQLLQPTLRGFMPAPAAMHDAMSDLLGHAIGTMAGTRSALDGLLAHFAPAAIEDRSGPPGLLDRLWPARRRARHWTAFRTHYTALRDEVSNDFHALFGRAFLAAYEQQLQRLDDAPPAAPHG